VTTLCGRIWDRERGRTLEARVQVLASTGEFCTPAGALLKVGGGEPSFYSDGAFSVDVPGGQVDLVAQASTADPCTCPAPQTRRRESRRHMTLPFSRAGYACHSSREEGSRI
jgi:hypothetical protein